MALLVEYQFFPPVALFAALKGMPKLFFESHDHFQKMQYRNRFEILSASGGQMVSYPLAGGRNKNRQPMKAVELFLDEKKLKENWRTLTSAYNNSPYFEYYADSLEGLLLNPPAMLTGFCRKAMEWCLQKLSWEITMEETEAWEAIPAAEETNDLRGKIRPSSRTDFDFTPYYQTFDLNFETNLSILDLLFNLGPQQANEYLRHHAGTALQKLQIKP